MVALLLTLRLKIARSRSRVQVRRGQPRAALLHLRGRRAPSAEVHARRAPGDANHRRGPGGGADVGLVSDWASDAARVQRGVTRAGAARGEQPGSAGGEELVWDARTYMLG